MCKILLNFPFFGVQHVTVYQDLPVQIICLKTLRGIIGRRQRRPSFLERTLGLSPMHIRHRSPGLGVKTLAISQLNPYLSHSHRTTRCLLWAGTKIEFPFDRSSRTFFLCIFMISCISLYVHIKQVTKHYSIQAMYMIFLVRNYFV